MLPILNLKPGLSRSVTFINPFHKKDASLGAVTLRIDPLLHTYERELGPKVYPAGEGYPK